MCALLVTLGLCEHGKLCRYSAATLHVTKDFAEMETKS